MKKIKKATSIVEAMIVMLIIVVWVTWLYNIFNVSMQLSNSTQNRIEAIEISREAIEAMKNKRDTSWLMFGWDTKNCFNTLNYDSWCVWNWWNRIENKSYIIYQNTNFKWYLEEKSPTWWFSDSNYRNNFRVFRDTDWFYTQTWTINPTIFTREVKIENMTNTWFTVKSIVQWTDSSFDWVHKVVLENLITNWK